MHRYLMDILCCPKCRSELSWHVESQTIERIQEARIACCHCGNEFEVHDEIGVFLIEEEEAGDLWEEVESHLARLLRENPDVRSRLLESRLEDLSPADLQFRAMVLEEQGDFAGAVEAERCSLDSLYAPQYKQVWDSQLSLMVDHIGSEEGVLCDLASGHCYLVQKIIKEFDRKVVATDISPLVLHRNKERLEFLGFYDAVSMLAFDARSSPLKTGSVNVLTTNLGLANIQNPGTLLKELRRIAGGSFWILTHFYPAEDEANWKVIEEYGLEELYDWDSAVKGFSNAGWSLQVMDCRPTPALPTPPAEVIEGARVDALPAVSTELEWKVLRAS